MKKSVFFLAVFALCARVFAGEVEVSIRFYDKKVYHVSGALGEPVYVEVRITNSSPVTYRFKLADDRIFSVDFDVRSLSNQSLPPADYLQRRRSESRNVFFREIAVEPQESFAFVEDIRNYADMREAGSFIVQARIFPELLRTGNLAALESNRLNLNLRPALDDPPFEFDVETNAVLAREKLPPDGVVSYMLSARQKTQWEKFFLYLDLEAMIRRDPVRNRSWQNESEEGRFRMTARYRDDLSARIADGDISLIPNDFRVENTSYNGEQGTVVVTEWFQEGRVTERRRYTYYLRRHDDIWLIQDYTVEKLGTE
ncbi:MAG: hypothetical protein LBJ31_03410 [Treponema sp.]|jgi:hypothetical protein|nr:hypothetical protein [Treponema sp.]